MFVIIVQWLKHYVDIRKSETADNVKIFEYMYVEPETKSVNIKEGTQRPMISHSKHLSFGQAPILNIFVRIIMKAV